VAFPNISDIATTTLEARSGKVQDNVSKNNAILFRLQDKAERPVNGGRLIYEELSFQENANGQWYSGYDTLSVAAQDVISAAEYAWKQYAIAVTISGMEELQNDGEAAVLNLLAKRIQVAESSMANAIAQGLYGDGTAFGGKALTGLDAAIPYNPAVGTYGGINRALYPFWRPQVRDSAATPTAATILAEMNAVWISCTRGADHPDLIMSGGTIFNTFLGALQPNQRFTDPKLANAGFTTVKYMNADVVLDGGIGGYATATDMYFLNTKYIHFRPHARRNMVPIGKKRQAVNQDATVEMLGFAGNMTSSGLQFQGRLKGD
jgi:hypothetical protein